ncbi:MAG: tRNA epoxyqueuosine(34) reductase QueG, partial [Sedimentibacter sp.]
MEQKIISIARSLGINVVGVTTTLNYSYLYSTLIERARKGYNSEFEEKDINKRLDVRNVFPQCKSIIAIGISYAPGYKKQISSKDGLLSVVSFGEDYHVKIKNILIKLANEIEKHMEFNYVACVDTTPLLDREICKNAGIGQYGKNTMLINDNYGSFIYIGYLLTDIEIAKNKLEETIDICNGCEICVKSCPNNAILKNGGINSKRCVSYLTQTKNYIPIQFRHNMGNQIYGCDVCQLTCPKNKINSDLKTT